MTKAEEKISDCANTSVSKIKYEICSCNKIGQSGLFKIHFILKPSKNEAEEAARHIGNANGAEYHSRNAKDPLFIQQEKVLKLLVFISNFHY